MDRAAPPRSTAPPDVWLPDFCALGTVLPLLFGAQGVALVAVLAPGGQAPSLWRSLGLACLFACWLSVLMATVLCAAKTPLRRLPAWPGSMLVLLLAGLLGIGCAQVAIFVAPLLDLHLDGSGFALRVAALAMLVVGVVLRYGYVREQWQRQTEAKARAELDALQARIRPHFLFNTLNAITSLVHSAPHQAETALLDLADLLRAALRAGSALVELNQEVELARRYLAIEQMRLGERLQVDIEMEPSLGSLRLPALILQPLVENAVLHGIARLPAGGTVSLQAWTEDGKAQLRIHNPCPPPSATDTGVHAGHGIALDNVQHRLHAGLGAQARLQVARGPQSYTVILELPLEPAAV